VEKVSLEWKRAQLSPRERREKLSLLLHWPNKLHLTFCYWTKIIHLILHLFNTQVKLLSISNFVNFKAEAVPVTMSKQAVMLLAMGSFNPPTIMHFRIMGMNLSNIWVCIYFNNLIFNSFVVRLFKRRIGERLFGQIREIPCCRGCGHSCSRRIQESGRLYAWIKYWPSDIFIYV